MWAASLRPCQHWAAEAVTCGGPSVEVQMSPYPLRTAEDTQPLGLRLGGRRGGPGLGSTLMGGIGVFCTVNAVHQELHGDSNDSRYFIRKIPPNQLALC